MSLLPQCQLPLRCFHRNRCLRTEIVNETSEQSKLFNFNWTQHDFKHFFSDQKIFGLAIFFKYFFQTQNVFPDPNFFKGKKFIDLKFYWFQQKFGTIIFSDPKCFQTQNFFSEFFFFGPKIFLKYFSRPKIFFWLKIFVEVFFWPKIYKAEDFRLKSCCCSFQFV